MKRSELAGKVYGAWTVLSYFGKRRWLCRCRCGTERTVTGWYLTTGKSTKCRRCCALPPGEAAFNNLMAHNMSGAAQRGLEWTLARDEARALFDGNCAYCGQQPKAIWKSFGGTRIRQAYNNTGVHLYNGIDRVDNTKGYVQGNCVSCCKVCNRMKHAMTKEDFLAHIESIALHMSTVALQQ